MLTKIIKKIFRIMKVIINLEHLKEEVDYIKNWQQDFYKEKPTKYPICLSEKEVEKLINIFKYSKNYLEYGLGGSTFLALSSNVEKITTVESDQDWIFYIQSWASIATNIKKGRLNIRHINIGKIGAWGHPIDESEKNNYPDYSTGGGYIRC